MKKLNSTFNKKIFKFIINDFIKNTNFAINKIVFNKLFIFIIIMSEHNNITLFN